MSHAIRSLFCKHRPYPELRRARRSFCNAAARHKRLYLNKKGPAFRRALQVLVEVGGIEPT